MVLDGLGPVSSAEVDTAMRLRKSMTVMRKERNPLKPYDSIDEMVRARLGVSDLSDDAARLLCERSARQVGKHFYWRTDPALNWVSPIILTDEQILDCLRNIEAPLLSWMATPFARWYSEDKVRARQAATQHGRHETIEGLGLGFFEREGAPNTGVKLLVDKQDVGVNQCGVNIAL